MSDTRDFVWNSLERDEIKDYWSEVETRAEEIIEPTIGVHQNGEVLFSWDLNDYYYFEVLFFEDSSIETFWANSDEATSGHFLPSSTEEAAMWTIEQFQHVR